jgi:hypothetical protein
MIASPLPPRAQRVRDPVAEARSEERAASLHFATQLSPAPSEAASASMIHYDLLYDGPRLQWPGHRDNA